jgi:MHS family metabolite:H+ symporter-like MFS transporter
MQIATAGGAPDLGFAPSDTAYKVTTADLHRAAWASSLGSALVYYDFALYSLASYLRAAVLPQF